MKYDLAVFDMDGTILDTLEDLKESTNYTLRKLGCPERSLEEIRWFVGNGALKLFLRAMPEGLTEEDVPKILAIFKEHYSVYCADHTRPYEGIKELIGNLKAIGCRTAVVSNKPDYGVQTLTKQYFEGCFDYSVGVRDGVAAKPAPDSVFEVLRQLNIPVDRAVYIGDSDVDLETAANAGMDCIGVDWGFRGRKFLEEHGAKMIVDRPEEILGIIKGQES